MAEFEAYPTAEYLDLPHPVDTWVIDRVLPFGGSLSLYGPPKHGKSYLALQLAAAVCADTEAWMGYRARQNGRVLYCQMDLPRSTWQTEHLQVCQRAHLPLEAVYHADRESLPWPFDIRESESYEALAEIVERIEPLVVIYDVVREMHSANENDSGEMKEVTQLLMQVAAGAATVYVGHAKKPSELGIGSTVDGLRGSSYLTGKMDTIVQCRKSSLNWSGRTIADTKMKTHRTPHLWEEIHTEDTLTSTLDTFVQPDDRKWGRQRLKERTVLCQRSGTS